jgi:hypothetical protein
MTIRYAIFERANLINADPYQITVLEGEFGIRYSPGASPFAQSGRA